MTDELRARQKAGRAGAGIGAIPDQAGGDLVFNGGNINAVGYEKSAGIGGSYRQAMR
ncbi:MAG: hypothetical protein IJ087_00895 [Eggerthellaceae bacterium]|nr:hypothetical protein [Eggerthellaceae bacterium]